MSKPSDFIASRISWRARQNGFPNSDVTIIETENDIELVVKKTNVRMTSQYLWVGEERIFLESIKSVSFEEKGEKSKSQQTALNLTLSNGKHAIVTLPPGEVFYGFFNILLMIVNLVR